ncbi:hypothetical protein EV13_1913 [Prochlorococcus sp. MIT 0702]|nr:hypothetical protein EV13_1913 [Prochlorococcus sp. MIT 0702]KGG28074.1 hypothetical protein EV12_0822 [Prochlorococcus sp. MIT 0701]KGG32845.1 hypothetical protein EV14_1988 [Prochlorococcus sp. MIT 0703]
MIALLKRCGPITRARCAAGPSEQVISSVEPLVGFGRFCLVDLVRMQQWIFSGLGLA